MFTDERIAVGHVGLTEGANKRSDTLTFEGEELVATRTAIQARTGGAVVEVGLTERAGISESAETRERVDTVDTRGAILARRRSTFVDVHLAKLT
jgi:hypothetical protein